LKSTRPVVTRAAGKEHRTGSLAKIDGEQQSRGIIIPFGDLLIGATALEVGYPMVTANVRHFRLIPGLTVVQL